MSTVVHVLHTAAWLELGPCSLVVALPLVMVIGVLQLYAAPSQLRSFQVFTARVACDRVAAGYYIVFYL